MSLIHLALSMLAVAMIWFITFATYLRHGSVRLPKRQQVVRPLHYFERLSVDDLHLISRSGNYSTVNGLRQRRQATQVRARSAQRLQPIESHLRSRQRSLDSGSASTGMIQSSLDNKTKSSQSNGYNRTVTNGSSVELKKKLVSNEEVLKKEAAILYKVRPQIPPQALQPPTSVWTRERRATSIGPGPAAGQQEMALLPVQIHSRSLSTSSKESPTGSLCSTCRCRSRECRCTVTLYSRQQGRRSQSAERSQTRARNDLYPPSRQHRSRFNYLPDHYLYRISQSSSMLRINHPNVKYI